MVKNTKLKPRHIIAKNIQQHGKKILKKISTTCVSQNVGSEGTKQDYLRKIHVD